MVAKLFWAYSAGVVTGLMVSYAVRVYGNKFLMWAFSRGDY